MNCGAAVTEVVRHYGQGVAEQSELSLSLLRAIDDTVEWLASMQKEAAGGVAMGEEILKALRNCKRERVIDAKGDVHDLYAAVEVKLKEVVRTLEHKRDAAKRDHRIKKHQDDLVAEFESAILAISQLHDMLVDLRWAIAEHDADLEKPAGKAFANTKELFAALKV